MRLPSSRSDNKNRRPDQIVAIRQTSSRAFRRSAPGVIQDIQHRARGFGGDALRSPTRQTRQRTGEQGMHLRSSRPFRSRACSLQLRKRDDPERGLALHGPHPGGPQTPELDHDRPLRSTRIVAGQTGITIGLQARASSCLVVDLGRGWDAAAGIDKDAAFMVSNRWTRRHSLRTVAAFTGERTPRSLELGCTEEKGRVRW